jgi:S-formylglutathione hydrolase
MSGIELVSAQKTFGGWLKRFRHRSEVLDCDMIFGVFLPPQAEVASVPLLWWLSGLTCTDENFMIKAGALRHAAELGLAIICPDTSPRGTDLPGEHETYDFGSGAGFYVNATQEPWSRHYRMYDYVTAELPEIARRHLPLNGLASISGHSMGGHGALICALKNPGTYQSVSAFAPICHPAGCLWGIKAFSNYLGEERNAWSEWDASQLVHHAEEQLPILIDQGTEDEWLGEQLKPGSLEQACIATHHPLELRMQEGYDHSYFFVASFIDEHLDHHARALGLNRGGRS